MSKVPPAAAPVCIASRAAANNQIVRRFIMDRYPSWFGLSKRAGISGIEKHENDRYDDERPGDVNKLMLECHTGDDRPVVADFSDATAGAITGVPPRP